MHSQGKFVQGVESFVPDRNEFQREYKLSGKKWS